MRFSLVFFGAWGGRVKAQTSPLRFLFSLSPSLRHENGCSNKILACLLTGWFLRHERHKTVYSALMGKKDDELHCRLPVEPFSDAIPIHAIRWHKACQPRQLEHFVQSKSSMAQHAVSRSLKPLLDLHLNRACCVSYMCSEQKWDFRWLSALNIGRNWSAWKFINTKTSNLPRNAKVSDSLFDHGERCGLVS